MERLRQALPGVRLTTDPQLPLRRREPQASVRTGYDDTLRRLGCYATSLAILRTSATADFRTPLNAGLATLVAADPALAQLLLPDRVHPSPAGHLRHGGDAAPGLERPALVSRVELDVTTKTVVATEQTTVSGLAWTAQGPAGRSSTRRCPCHSASTTPTSRSRRRPGPISRPSTDSPRRPRPAGRPLRAAHRRPGDRHVRRRRAGEGREPRCLRHPATTAGLRGAGGRSPTATSCSACAGGSWPLPRRSLQLQLAIDALTAQDAAARQARREAAQPRPRRYELVPR